MRRICSFFASLALFATVALAVLFIYDTLFPPISTLMVARTALLQPVWRDYVPLRRISPHMMTAVIAAEDTKFCTHHGVDWQALHEVVKEKLEDGDDDTRGASTLTMQTVKNLFLWPGRAILRKAIEIPGALLIDLVWGKHHTLEVYLNVAEFGRGLYGVEAASRRYFGKHASALTEREAALLAATLPNPKRRNPRNPSAYVSGYAGTIQARMHQVSTRCVR